MGPEILGTPLPDTVFGWLGLLVSIVAALLGMLSAAEKFVDLFGPSGTEVLRPWGGLALPVGWVAWCIALLIAHRTPVSFLIVFLGTGAITATGQALYQRCKA